MKKVYILGLLMVALCFFSFNTTAQEAQEKFGKNRVQYKDFDWRYFSSENFDIYYYDGGVWLARLAARFLEDEFEKVTDVIGYAPYSKTKIFLYNSVTDLQQSNVGVNENNWTIGGQTDFVKSHVEIAFPGTVIGFKDELIYNISEMLIYDMMFGGSLTDMFQSAYLLNLPDWFMEGAAKYLAEGWSVKMDDHVRDLLKDERVKKLTKFTGDEARMVGHSIWNFIAERYGKSNISNILNLTRIIRNEERSISNTLGMSFKQFLFEWQSFYTSMTGTIDANYQYPQKENRLLGKNRRDLVYQNLAFSPNGRYLAYTINNQGKFRVFIQDLEQDKEKKILSGGYKVINQDVNYYQPIVSWQDDNVLGIIGPEYGRNYLWLYDISSNSRIKKELGRLSNIHSFDISEGGSLAVLSADIDGKNDLFLISLRRNSLKRVTNDLFDDTYPQFIPGTSNIIFSSNRTNDTITANINEEMEELKDNFNLFVYSLDTTRDVLSRITNTISKDIKPIPANEFEVYFLSDQKGIFNLYKYNLSTKIYNQVSNFAFSIKDYDINQSQNELAIITIDDEREHIFYYPDYNLNNNIFTPPTRRQEIMNAKFVSRRLQNRKQQSMQDSLASAPKVQPPAKSEDLSPLDSLIQSSEDLIDTDNYIFNQQVVEESKPRESFLTSYRKTARESRILGPLDYETRFSADNILTSFVIDPLIGFGIQLETQMNDLLENHKFFGGVLATTDLGSGRLFGEYQFLKNRIDYHVRYDRTVLKRETIDRQFNQKYILNKYTFTAALPLTVSSRISLSPFFANTSFFELDPAALTNNYTRLKQERYYFGGFKASYVFDNSIQTGLNQIEGTRAKINLIQYESLQDNRQSFSNISLDFRHYQNIFRNMVFATRLFYGRFLGNNKQNYLLGGMDNWLFNQTNYSDETDPLLHFASENNSNILFAEYVTSLRGFDYNTFHGSNALLFNAELRLPIVKMFYRGPISSNFFRNLQFVGFYDMGSAWTGNSPFATENSINTQLIDNGGPFQIKLKNYKNPWLSSYGAGVRTVLLGYYVKFDMAYPIEDYVVKDPRYYVTLGYDF